MQRIRVFFFIILSYWLDLFQYFLRMSILKFNGLSLLWFMSHRVYSVSIWDLSIFICFSIDEIIMCWGEPVNRQLCNLYFVSLSVIKQGSSNGSCPLYNSLLPQIYLQSYLVHVQSQNNCTSPSYHGWIPYVFERGIGLLNGAPIKWCYRFCLARCCSYQYQDVAFHYFVLWVLAMFFKCILWSFFVSF